MFRDAVGIIEGVKGEQRDGWKLMGRRRSFFVSAAIQYAGAIHPVGQVYNVLLQPGFH